MPRRSKEPTTIPATSLQYAPLDRACIEVRGADAAEFLHGQLSRAMLTLESADAPLAGWADARGRVRALFRVLKLPERWLLVTPLDGVDALLKKLRMFVLRSKVELGRAEDVAVAALLGDATTVLAQHGVEIEPPPNRSVCRDALCFVRVGERYWQAFGPSAALEPLAAALATTTKEAAALAEIELGIPEVVPSIAERFVAQMLNLDELGAVSFDKGCYPGQEIIARVHNLGGVKRRARRYAAPLAPPAAGTPVLGEDGRAVGEVVRAAPAKSGAELLAVVDHSAAGAPLTCGGARLEERPLPFPVRRD
jgi:folate-binding protein YgfZ